MVGCSEVPHFRGRKRFLAVLVSEDQIALRSDYKAFSALSGNTSGDGKTPDELLKGFGKIWSERYAAS